jgi:peroxiredoxin
LQTNAQAYKIEIDLDNYNEEYLLILHYYGKSNTVVDTAFKQKSGSYVIKGDEKLKGGIYLIVTKQKNYFEILIDEDQVFSLQTSSPQFVDNMRIKGSQLNSDFYEYLKLANSTQAAMANLKKKLETAEDKNAINKEINELNEKVKVYRNNYISKNPDSFLSTVLLASKEVEMPDEVPTNEDGSEDSTFAYKYYKNHYWDNFDLSDDRLLRTPIFVNKLERYFTKVIMQHPDTLIKEGDYLVEMTKGNKETFKYIVWYITYETETSQIMGFDKAFVHFAEKYYLSGEAWWVNKKVLANMKDRVEKLNNVLIGNKAKNMILIDTNQNWVSLYDVNAKYTAVVFYDPDCGHCKKEMKALRDFYNDNKDKYDLKIYSVCGDTSTTKWKKYLNTHELHFVNVNGTKSVTPAYHDLYDIISTPTIFLLDKDKKIIAKKISASQMAQIIQRDFEARNKAN